MTTTRRQTRQRPRWARNWCYLPAGLDLSALLALPRASQVHVIGGWVALKPGPHRQTGGPIQQRQRPSAQADLSSIRQRLELAQQRVQGRAIRNQEPVK